MCAAGNATCVKSIESELLCAYIGLTEVTEALIKEGVYMKQKMKRLTALGISAAMLVSPAACGTPKDAANEVASEELGSGDTKWSKETTADGWVRVTNEGGATLGYSLSSGVTLLQADGYAFKDLNKNGTIDGFEDWREDADSRAANLTAMMTNEQIAGMMVVSGNLSNNISGKLEDDQTAAIADGVLGVQNGALTNPVADQAEWSNAMQAEAEKNGLGIPLQIFSDPRNSGWGIGISPWPDNLAISATFDPEFAQEMYQHMSAEYRALGITTLLGPQTDVATEPRWGRATGTFGEDPALSRDMMRGATNGLQSTFAEDGTDTGWGSSSVNAMMKHWPGDGAAQAGREAHDSTGSFNIYPNGRFSTQLIPFVDGALQLDGLTESASAAMTSYSIAWSENEEYGELVATSFSEYKVQLLRSYGFDGVICTDWQVVEDEGKVWGVEDLTPAERVCKAIKAGVDQFGGTSDLTIIRDGIALLEEELGEEAAAARMQETAKRLLVNYFNVGLFENPYLDVQASAAAVANAEDTAAAFDAQEKTIVMLKNDGVISENTGSDKPTVYIPLVYTPATIGFVGQNYYSADLPVEMEILEQYFNVVTDTVSETLTGPADENGEATLAYEDVIRASQEELAACDYALVFTRSPKNTSGWSITGGFDMETQSYVPLSLQYGEYTANSESVKKESEAGRMVDTPTQTPYGEQMTKGKENQSYYGATAKLDNATDLDMIRYAQENMPEDAKVIVAVNTTGKSPVASMVVNAFEADSDAILYGLNIDNRAFLDIAAGKVEPSALLPIGLPANMEAVERQSEDLPRDMECHVDTAGNTYSFGFGMNWSGVINDERTAAYLADPLTEPAAKPQS